MNASDSRFLIQGNCESSPQESLIPARTTTGCKELYADDVTGAESTRS